MEIISINAQSCQEALHEVKKAALETIYDAIVNREVGGQDYTWYVDSEGKVWIIQLHEKYEHRNNPNAMQCWLKPTDSIIPESDPEKMLLKNTFSVNELSRMADKCCFKATKNYKVQLIVNEEVKETKFFETREEAERGYKAYVDLKPGDKAEIKIEPNMDWVISCEAHKQYLKERKDREERGLGW